ncbi:MAG: hypothetical protein NTX14_03310 [Candidatus Nealsonbacteria bacterium]|nr:hypothetical protein [Candidatus Nealsonbacteria bacterium]
MYKRSDSKVNLHKTGGIKLVETEWDEIFVEEIVSRIVELDKGIKQQFTEIGTAMRQIMVSDRQMNEVLSKSNVLDRFIWDLHHELAGFWGRSVPGNSALRRLYALHRQKIQAENDIGSGINSIGSFLRHMVEALNDPVLREYLPPEYLKQVDSLSGDFDIFRLHVAQLEQYSSRVPRIVPSEADMAVFMNVRKENPSNSPAFLDLAAYLKMEGRHIDSSVKENAEQKRRRFKEEQNSISQRFAKGVSDAALSAAFNNVGIDPFKAIDF